MIIGISYDTLKSIFRHNALLLYVVSDGYVASVGTVSSDGTVGTRYDLIDDPPTDVEAFTDDFPSALAVTSITS